VPPPIPGPIVSPTTWFEPRAAPRHHSPKIAQLASLSSVAGKPSVCPSRSRNGKFVHPRLGVGSTMPVFVLSGPGEPIPTPAIFLPRACSMDARASFTIRSITASAPCSEMVGAETSPTSSEPSSATVPTTMLVPPMSIPTMWRTGLLDGEQDVLDRERLHAQVMTQRAARRSVRRAGTARPAVALDHPVTRSARPEPERRDGGAEDRHRRRADRLREVQRRAVVGHQHGGAPDDLRRLAQGEPAARVTRPPPPSTALHRLQHLVREPDILRSAHHHDRHARGQSLGELSVVRPALAAPDRARRQRRERLADPVLAQEFVGGPTILARGLEPRRCWRHRPARTGGAGRAGQGE